MLLIRQSLAILILAVGQPVLYAADDVRALSVAANDLVYDPFSKIIYASVSGKVGDPLGNTVTAIDPESGVFVYSLPVGNEPNKLAVSDDGRYLYVALDSTGIVQRIDLQGRFVDLEFSLAAVDGRPRFAFDMAVQPGNANVVAVALSRRASDEAYDGVAIFDEGAKRFQEPQDTSTLIEFSDSPDTLYGLNYQNTGYDVRKFRIDQSGVVQTDSVRNGFPEGYAEGFKYAEGRLYSTGGSILNATNLSPIGRVPGLPGLGLPLPEPERDRIYYLLGYSRGGISVRTYGATERNLIAEVGFPQASGAASAFLRWGDQGLAFRTTGRQVILIRTSMVPAEIVQIGQTPRLDTVTPATLNEDSPTATITLDGDGFTADSVVRINGWDSSTTYMSPTQLTARLPATNMTLAGVITVAVYNPGLGGGLSDSQIITLLPHVPARVASIFPARASTDTETVVTIAGTDLFPASEVTFSGSGVTATILEGVTRAILPIRVTIAADAAPGLRTLTVHTSAGTSEQFSGFEVVAARSGNGPLTTTYMPSLRLVEGADVGIALSNPTLSPVSLTLTARGYDGQLVTGTDIANPATVLLEASAQRALRVVDLFGSGIAGVPGWVEIASSSSAFKGFFLVYDSAFSFNDGAGFQSVRSSRLIFPNVTISSTSSTLLTFVNAGAQSISTVSMSFYESSGRLASRRSIALGPNSGFSGSVRLIAPELQSFDGYVAVQVEGATESAGTLIGFEIYKDQSDIAALNAVPVASALRTAYVPHVASHGGYISKLVLVNPTSSAQLVKISANALERNGSPVTPASREVTRSVPAFGRLEEATHEMFGWAGPDLVTGFLRWEVQGQTQGLIGHLEYGTTDGVLLSAVPAQSTGFSELFFSHVAEGRGYYTGLALVNANAESTPVLVESFDSNGHKTGARAMTMAPSSKRTLFLSELLPTVAVQLSGFVRIGSLRPVFALQLFGSRDSLRFLANVAAQGATMPRLASGQAVSADAGGIVTSADGLASVIVPPGALMSSTSIRISVLAPQSLPSTVYDEPTIAAIDVSPVEMQLREPVTLTFPLPVHLEAGTALDLVTINGQARSYAVNDFSAVVDESGRTASARVTHFGTFAVPYLPDRTLEVLRVEPRNGLPGTHVRIEANGLFPNLTDNVITFAGPNNTAIRGNVVAANYTWLTVVVPEGAQTGNLMLRVNGQSSSGVLFSVEGNNPVPSIRLLNPASVREMDTTAVTIVGAGFRPNSVVLYDGQPVYTAYIDSNSLSFSVQRFVLGTHHISVRTASPGGGVSSTIEFDVVSASVPGAPSQVVWEGPYWASGIVGKFLGTSTMVKVLDQYGRAIPYVPVTFEVRRGGGKVVPATPRTGDDGRMFTNITLGPEPGLNEFVAMVAGLEPAVATVIGTRSAARATELNGLPDTATAGSTLSWSIRVTDDVGGPVPYANAFFTYKNVNGLAGTHFVPTDADAEIVRFITVGKVPGVETYEVRGAPEGEPIVRRIRVLAGDPFQLVKVAGDGQTGSLSAPLQRQLVIEVRDRFGNVLPDVPITVTPSVGGTVKSIGPYRSDRSGRVYVTAYANVAGPIIYTASARGVPPVVFAATGR